MHPVMITIVFSLTLFLTGCGEKKPQGPDKAKMEACTKDTAALKDAASCKKCCKATGAVGHTYSKIRDRAECTCGMPEEKPRDEAKIAACAKDAEAKNSGAACKKCCGEAGATGHAWKTDSCACE